MSEADDVMDALFLDLFLAADKENHPPHSLQDIASLPDVICSSCVHEVWKRVGNARTVANSKRGREVINEIRNMFYFFETGYERDA